MNRRLRRLDAWRRIAAELAAQTPMEDRLRAVLQIGCDLFGADSGSLYLIGPAAGEFDVIATTVPEPAADLLRKPRPRPGGITASVLETGQPVLIPDTRLDERVNPVTLAAGIVSLVALPIRGRDGPIGILFLNGTRPRAFRTAMLADLLAMTDHLAVAVENIRLLRAALEAEALRRLNDERRALITTISHELRTPLALILGYAELLSERRLPAREADLAHELLGGALRLAGVVEDIVLAADLDAGQVRLALERVVLTTFLELWSATGPPSQPVILRLNEPLPPVQADSGRLTQVLHRLRSFVAQVAPPGGAIVVTAEVTSDVVWVVLSDASSGAPASLSPVLAPSSRSPMGRERSLPDGLGLAVAQRLVELHGGEVVAESGPGPGVAVAFSLPRAPDV